MPWSAPTRSAQLKRLKEEKFDVVVVGGENRTAPGREGEPQSRRCPGGRAFRFVWWRSN